MEASSQTTSRAHGAAEVASAALAALVPKAVAVAVALPSEDSAAEEALFPAERVVIADAVARRRAEFAGVRACARRALVSLDRPAAAIVPGASREPRWPQGVVGSLTHCAGLRAAALALEPNVLTLGIDAEVREALPSGVLPLVATDAERSLIERLTADRADVPWDRLLFSAKESVFKAWFPLRRRWLNFTDCEVSFDLTAHAFSARPCPAGHHRDGRTLAAFQGRWSATATHLLTAVWLSPVAADGKA